MAGLGAVNQVGESIAALLRTRRTLLAEENRLAPVPASQDIAHVPLAKLTGTTPPGSGLSLTCFHIGRSDHPLPRGPMEDPSRAAGISLELTYLLVSWSSTAADELSLLSWAMLELNRYPVLGPGQLLGNGWERDERIQIVPGTESAEQLARIWDSFKVKYHLSTTFHARVVRIGYGKGDDGPPVVASRFAFADGDVATEPTT
jgi:hypothetical protein